MQRYKDHRPTQFDRHVHIENRSNWYVVPVMQTRDSGPAEQSNFESALRQLGGESEHVEVHRFGHWGPGWYEIILVSPNNAALVKVVEDIEKALEDYPILDEDDHCEREYACVLEAWENYGSSDFTKALLRSLECSDSFEELIYTYLDSDKLYEIYSHNCNTSFEVESDGSVYFYIEQAVKNINEADLLRYLADAATEK